MKIKWIYAQLIVLIWLLSNCGKTSPKNTTGPPPADNPGGCLVKTVSTIHPQQPANTYYFGFTYDDNRNIVRTDRGSLDQNGNPVPGDYFTVDYDAQRRIRLIHYFSGGRPSGDFSVHYAGNFVHELLSYQTNSQDTTLLKTYDWNLHGNRELDDIVYGEDANGNSSNISWLYDPNGALHGSTETVVFGTTPQEEPSWTTFQPGVGTETPNPFLNGTTNEQRFLYVFFGVSSDQMELSPGMPNGVYEQYTYRNGTKETEAHWNVSFKLDSSQKVNQFTNNIANDGPNYGSYYASSVTTLTYDCK